MSRTREQRGSRKKEKSVRRGRQDAVLAHTGRSRGWAILAFTLAAFVIYAPALGGTFVSDDLFYIVHNPYVGEGDTSWLPIFDPRGEPTLLTGNFAPVHLAVHRLAWNVFAWNPWGHHALNILLHVVASLLLVPLLRRSRVPPLLALFGGAVFLVHPANVEAVGAIFQLKTSLSQVLALAALLWLDRRPVVASGAFALALLAKPTAAFALPVAAAIAWARRTDEPGRATWLALGAWGVVLALFAWAEFPAFAAVNPDVAPIHPDPLVQFRSSVSYVLRYAVMAATSWGVSAFHEPDPVVSWLNPWWLGGLALLIGLGVRTVVTLRARSVEAAWWIWAAAAFVPVSQIFPFLYPFADRYLYAILPGLLGGAFLALGPLAEPDPSKTRRRQVLVVAGIALLVGFGVHAHTRARLWGSPELLQADSARHYPSGMNAHLVRATHAVISGRSDRIVEELRGAFEQGYDRIDLILAYPPYNALRGRPAFDALIEDMAGVWVERYAGRENLSQAELYTLGVAYRLRGEIDAARRTLERAAELGGARSEAVKEELRALEARR